MTTSARIEEALNRRILKHFLELDGRGNFVNPPRTDEDLDSFIRAAYGVRLPRKVITPGHQSPFQFVADIFFERVGAALGFANRSGGKTFAVALLNHLEMVFKRGVEITSAGAAKNQAERCYTYFRRFCQLPWFLDLSSRYEAITGKKFYDDKESLKSHTTFGNGARLEIITGSEKGFRSPHPHKSRIDEIDLIPWSLLETALSMAETRDGIMGQDVFTSTRQLSDGSMQLLLDKAHEKGIAVYKWNIWEVLSRCGRRCKGDPEHGDCPIVSYCKGRAHYCDGFISVQDFIKKVQILSRTTFLTEWENQLPRQESLVYYMLGPQHIMTPQRLYDMCGVYEPQLTWDRISGLDFGSSPGHPFCVTKLFRIPVGWNPWLLFWEYSREQDLLANHAAAIKRSPGYLPNEVIYCDHDAQDRVELKALGVSTRRAIKGPKSLNVGIDYVSTLLSGRPPYEQPELFFWHTCSFTIGQFQKYSWPFHADGRPDRSGNPMKAHDDAPDAVRMALYSHKSLGGRHYWARQVRNI